MHVPLKTSIVLLYLSAIISPFAFSQEYPVIFSHLTKANGLPIDQVNCTTRDSSGFMWLGTSEGLFKYDGFIYKFAGADAQKHKAVLSSFIADVMVDRKGFIWVTLAYRGIVVLDRSGNVVDLLDNNKNKSFKGDRSHKIRLDENGKVWCSTDDGLYNLDIKEGKIIILRKLDLIRAGHNTNITGDFSFDQTGKMWICTYTGLVIYDLKSKQLFHKKNNPGQLSILKESFPFYSIFLDTEKRKVWYSTWEPSLKLYDELKNNIQVFYSGAGLPQPDYKRMATHFLKDSHQHLWLATHHGLLLLNRENNKLEQAFANERSENTSIISNSVNHAFENKDGNLWLSTNSGVSILPFYSKQFNNISATAVKKFPFADKDVSAIIRADTNRLLVCTYGADGIYETDNSFNVTQHFSFFNDNYNWIWSFHKNEKNKTIFISAQKGMLLYHTKTNSIEKFNSAPFGKFFPVNSFVPGNDGELWMSRYRDEFIRYEMQSGKYERFPITAMGIPAQQIKIAKDDDDHFWIIANRTGLYRYNKKSRSVTEHLAIKKGDSNSIKQTEIILLKKVGQYCLIGYDQMGFSLYDPNNKTFKHLDRSNGLEANRVNDVLTDKNGNIWMATSNGIGFMNMVTGEIVNYNYQHGLLNSNVNALGYLNDSTIAAGTDKGVATFNPKKLLNKLYTSPPFITEIKVYGNQTSTDSVFTKQNPLEISYKQNLFSLEYLSPDYTYQQQIEYAYMLAGVDENWIYAGPRRYVSYTNLKEGNYVFKLKSRLPGNDWVESSSSLHIHVDAPFYGKWWFKLFVLLMTAGLLYAIFRYRIKQLLRIEKMRAEISSDLHDEVGATLSSISIFSEMARQSLHSKTGAEKYLQHIGERSRDSIEKMSDIIWSINPAHDSLQEMLVRMKDFATETIEGKDITMHWEESISDSGFKLEMAERKNFYLLFKEAFINAIKYAEANNVIVQLSSENKMVSLKIKDDGVGFNIDTTRQGNGIKNIIQRAVLLKGKAFIHSSQGKGTTVSVVFPH